MGVLQRQVGADEATAATPSATTPSIATTAGAERSDLEELTERVLRTLMQRLTVESERRGWQQWPW
jgi:hypothetical protein